MTLYRRMMILTLAIVTIVTTLTRLSMSHTRSRSTRGHLSLIQDTVHLAPS